MPPCRFWKDQPDGFHGYCQHPKAQQGDPCILNTEDECVLREEAFEAIHTCAVCGHTMSSREYEEKGCIFCGADSEEEQ